MADVYSGAISALRDRLSQEEAALTAAQMAVVKTKTAINLLCEMDDIPPLYPDVDAPTSPVAPAPESTRRNGVVRPDQYYNRPLATCVKEFLEGRKQSGLGPASVDEVYSALKAGGYNFESRDDANAMRGLAVSVSKNTGVFARLPSGLIGLAEWYGGPKRKAKTKDAVAAPTTDQDDPAADDLDDVANGDEQAP